MVYQTRSFVKKRETQINNKFNKYYADIGKDLTKMSYIERKENAFELIEEYFDLKEMNKRHETDVRNLTTKLLEMNEKNTDLEIKLDNYRFYIIVLLVFIFGIVLGSLYFNKSSILKEYLMNIKNSFYMERVFGYFEKN